MTKKPSVPLNAKSGGYAFTAMMFLYVLLSFLGQAVVGAVLEQGSTVYIAVCSLFSVISLLTVLLVFTLYGRNSFVKTTIIKKSNLSNYGLALAVSVGMFLGLGFINTLVANLIVNAGGNASSIQIPLDTFGQFILFSFVFAVFPAITEELFFRGLILSCFSQSKIWLAVLINAICFALYHCTLTQFFYQLVYGAILSLLAIKSKSVLPCILAHFINNFAVVLLQFLRVEIDLYNPLLIVVGAVLLLLAVTVIVVNLKGEKREKLKGETLSFLFPAGIFGLIVSVVLICGALMV